MLVPDWYPTSVDRQGKGVMLAASHSLKIVEIRTKRDDWRDVSISLSYALRIGLLTGLCYGRIGAAALVALL